MTSPDTRSTNQIRSFDQSLPHVLLRAREASMRFFRPLLARHDLTEQQWRVLRALNQFETPPDVGELAARTFLLGPSLSRILVRLVERGLVDRTPDEADQRRSFISLTAAGLEIVDIVGPYSEAQYAEIEQRYGRERLADLFGLLEDLADLEPADLEPAEPEDEQ